MDDRILKWLYDVRICIEEIESFINNENDFFKYSKNLMMKRAVERNLEIIGEAINRIITRDQNFIEKIANSKAIIGLRNQVIHAYDSVSDENIWSILTNHLPILKTEVDLLINDYERLN
jgi:uncharacterized protein with HEPN domain